MNSTIVQEFYKTGVFDLEIPENIFLLETCCVDGRVENDAQGKVPPLAIPGADAGIMACLLAALNTIGMREEMQKRAALDAFIQLKGGPAGVRFHTDHHAEHDHDESHIAIAKGCGHFKNSALYPEAYGLMQEDIALLSTLLKDLHVQGAVRIVLSGDHAEAAVVIVEDETRAAVHQNHLGQAFVYHAALHNKLLKALAAHMAGVLQTEEEALYAALCEANHRQTGETLHRLAQGKPQYACSWCEDVVTVRDLGAVV